MQMVSERREGGMEVGRGRRRRERGIERKMKGRIKKDLVCQNIAKNVIDTLETQKKKENKANIS